MRQNNFVTKNTLNLYKIGKMPVKLSELDTPQNGGGEGMMHNYSLTFSIEELICNFLSSSLGIKKSTNEIIRIMTGLIIEFIS